MVFGKMNWSALIDYVVQPGDMQLFQTYVNQYFNFYLNMKMAPGVIVGGHITTGTGLIANIGAGIALMPDGTFLAWPALTATMSAANPSNPRIDRVEMSYSNVNNTAVVDVNNVSKFLDILLQPATNVVAGTPGVSPAIPAATSQNVTLGYVHVAATQTILSSGDLQNLLLLDEEMTLTIANNQGSSQPLTGVIVDSSLVSSFTALVEITRVAGGITIKTIGTLYAYFDAANSKFQTAIQGIGDDVGVVIDSAQYGVTALMQFNYTSTNYVGGGYAGTMKLLKTKSL